MYIFIFRLKMESELLQYKSQELDAKLFEKRVSIITPVCPKCFKFGEKIVIINCIVYLEHIIMYIV